MDRPADDADELVAGLRAGDRRALARAITLAESTRTDHRAIADAVLDAVLPSTGGAVRVGISGPPGVGKSTFIESFGTHIVDLCTGRRTELSFRNSSGQLYVSLTRRPRGEVGVAGHIVRDPTGLLSAFQTRTDLQALEGFGDALRAFPYA